MNIEIIRQRIQQGKYLVKSHAVQHAIKEGFDRKHMVEAILNGKIIEDYPEDKRALICGHTKLTGNLNFYLHVVCEYADPVYIEFVTAYLPDETLWENPPLKRRKRQRK